MFDSQVVAEFFFQLLMKGTPIGQDFVFPYLLHIRDELFQRWKIGLSNISIFGNHNKSKNFRTSEGMHETHHVFNVSS